VKCLKFAQGKMVVKLLEHSAEVADGPFYFGILVTCQTNCFSPNCFFPRTALSSNELQMEQMQVTMMSYELDYMTFYMSWFWQFEGAAEKVRKHVLL